MLQIPHDLPQEVSSQKLVQALFTKNHWASLPPSGEILRRLFFPHTNNQNKASAWNGLYV